MYRVTVCVKGRRKSKVARTLALAREAENLFRSGLELRQNCPGGKSIRLQELCDHRIADIKQDRTEKYVHDSGKTLEAFADAVGDVDVSGISRTIIINYLKLLGNTRKAAYARSIIKALFNHAVREELIDKSPADNIPPIQVDTKKRYVPPAEDVEAVLAAADPEQKAYLLAIVYTLARVGEINRLTWADVDLEAQEITLWTRKKKGGKLTPRILPLLDDLAEVLQARPRDGRYVFMNKRTKNQYAYRTKLMGRLCRRAGVKYFSFHSFRHYGATKLASKGAPLPDIQAILGHELLTTTSIYIKSLKASTRKSMKLLED